MATNKEMQKIARNARHCGFAVHKTRGGHYKIVSENRAVLVLPFSPGTSHSERKSQRSWERFKKEHSK